MLLSPKRVMLSTRLPREKNKIKIIIYIYIYINKKVAVMSDCEALSIRLPDQLFLSLGAIPSFEGGLLVYRLFL